MKSLAYIKLSVGRLTNLVFVFSEIAFYIPLLQNHLCFEGQKYHQHDEYFNNMKQTGSKIINSGQGR